MIKINIMTSVLTQKWLWIIVFVLILIVIAPLTIALLIISLPPPYNAIATIILVIGWGIAAGYKDWIISKEKEEK